MRRVDVRHWREIVVQWSFPPVPILAASTLLILSLPRQAKEIHQLAESQFTWMAYMNYAVVGAVVGIICVIGKRILYYERKHLI